MSGLTLALMIVLSTGLAVGSDPLKASPPKTSLEFRLKSPDGAVVELHSQATPQLTVICFLGTECPLARLYGPRLSNLERKFAAQKVRFVGIDSNSQDSPDEVREFAKEHHLSFPLIKDPASKVADQFGARRTSEVFVVDQSLAIRYRGRIDDQYQPGVARKQPTRDDLRLALEELLAGKPVRVATTEAAGCLIGRVKPAATNHQVTFNNQVSRILDRHCTECHRAGEIGPFALTSYDEVIGWGDTLIETIDSDRMPPWNANPKHGQFANARVMPEADKQTLRDWVAAGMPLGDKSQVAPEKSGSTEWRLSRQPDLVIPMRDRPFAVPASGTVEYQYFVVDPKFTEERWISAAQVIPGNRGVVHHCIVFIRPPDGAKMRGVGWLTGYVPGQKGFDMHSGRARRVPAGSKLVFQMHYTPNGTEQSDLTRLGVNFVPASEVTHEVYSLIALDQEFEIPPQTAGYPVQARVKRMPKQGELLAIVPHMHVRGQSIQVMSRIGEKEQILLDVPRYDFNWQHIYELTTPVDLAKIDGLEFTARFDNSKNNPANPDPTQYVNWGDQTWEEMAVTFFEISEPREFTDPQKPATETKSAVVPEPADSPIKAAAVAAYVEDFYERFDANKDGIVDRAETPLVFRTYGFRQIDANNDGRITREEIESAARNRKLR
ncbi:MAG: alkyl hydroperoxide reductase/Thiol specific antioxidant/Mal allergen [Planctomycetaceae bacterium]|nr:alkyl hydroperoxide reductase/Thiol specific antioxidant/Mal allergen [Planctomycetaceae bacterium]